jgi:hypothetical protein
LAYPQGILEKTHETIGLLIKCTRWYFRGTLGSQNSVGGTVSKKGREPLVYSICIALTYFEAVLIPRLKWNLELTPLDILHDVL